MGLQRLHPNATSHLTHTSPPLASFTYLPMRICQGSLRRQHVSVKAYLKLCIMGAMKSPALDMELFFLALADRTRLRLLSLIDQDEVCVCFFVEVFKTNQPKISRHLAYLRKAGLVSARRQGKW